MSFLWSGVGLCCLGVEGLCAWTGNPLFRMMSWIVSSSALYSTFCRWCVFSLLYRYLMAACLFWDGWFEEYGMILSVKDGFL
jgi:hypothetical protein